MNNKKSYDKKELLNLLNDFGRTSFKSDGERLAKFLDVEKPYNYESLHVFGNMIYMRVIHLQVEGRLK